MDRQIVYPGSIPLETDLLNTNKNAMIGLSKLAAAILGTSTFLNGLACTPNSPADLTVKVAPGEIYSLQNIDGTAYSSIAADTTHAILKQGIMLDQATLSCPAPVTAGQSVNYLVQVAYQDTDAGATVLPYYNASNPAQAYSGPNNSGTAQNTVRKGVCTVSAKSGIAATTGTQTTPAPDAGYIGAFVVTVANGQTQITSGNISTYASAPFIPAAGMLVGGFQGGAFNTTVAGGTADAITVAFTPAMTAFGQGPIWWRATAANATSTPTLKRDGLAAKTIVKGAGAALAAGDIPGAGAWMCSQYDATLDKEVLLNPATGVSVATPSVVGTMRNCAISVTAASATATLTADEVVVETALGGTAYRLSNFNKTINLATTGAGGMDTGAAPVSGFVALYAIYNPTTQTSALLAVNATSAAQPNIYGGANMPAGYTASALVSVWPTDGTGKFKVGYQIDRGVYFPYVTALTNGTATTLTSFSLSAAIPKNARSWGGLLSVTGSTTTSIASSLAVAGDASGTGQQQGQVYGQANALGQGFPLQNVPVITAQTAYYTTANPSGNAVNVSSYTF